MLKLVHRMAQPCRLYGQEDEERKQHAQRVQEVEVRLVLSEEALGPSKIELERGERKDPHDTVGGACNIMASGRGMLRKEDPSHTDSTYRSIAMCDDAGFSKTSVAVNDDSMREKAFERCKVKRTHPATPISFL